MGESRGGIIGTLGIVNREGWCYMSDKKTQLELVVDAQSKPAKTIDEGENALLLIESKAAVNKFAVEWHRRLKLMASRRDCRCNRKGNPEGELSHGNPDCPVAVLLQIGRLMTEEAEQPWE
jgi:hypothetical protein